ncbi:MAG: SufS family cysteine desulfurase [Eggerthellaceae bacterium]|nr:SufS family cysteine desulfurase [Eggerthellaceae bacterium]
MLHVNEIRKDFPILDTHVFGHRLVYLDNAATMQVPEPVLRAVMRHYHEDNANVHRGIHALSERSTRALEEAREHAASFINARSADEVVFTSGTTASLNMLADMLVAQLPSGKAVVTTVMEHHANFVPWQQACARTGHPFLVAPLDGRGDLNLRALEGLLDANDVGVVAFAHVSNVLGTVNPVNKIVAAAHERGAIAVVDAAQSIRHEVVDVQAMGCDFLAFSGHKMGASTGIGVLYGKLDLLEGLQPVRFGGEMVDDVRIAGTTFTRSPLRFEAGTPNYVGAIGLSAAISYLENLGLGDVRARETRLIRHAEDKLKSVPGLKVLGAPAVRAGCLSFAIEGIHPFDLATMIDKLGVALRSGNQCAQPLLHEEYDVGTITRLSPAFYNTVSEIDYAVDALVRVCELLRSKR